MIVRVLVMRMMAVWMRVLKWSAWVHALVEVGTSRASFPPLMLLLWLLLWWLLLRWLLLHGLDVHVGRRRLFAHSLEHAVPTADSVVLTLTLRGRRRRFDEIAGTRRHDGFW